MSFINERILNFQKNYMNDSQEAEETKEPAEAQKKEKKKKPKKGTLKSSLAAANLTLLDFNRLNTLPFFKDQMKMNTGNPDLGEVYFMN